jgi:hypothetical protein
MLTKIKILRSLTRSRPGCRALRSNSSAGPFPPRKPLPENPFTWGEVSRGNRLYSIGACTQCFQDLGFDRTFGVGLAVSGIRERGLLEHTVGWRPPRITLALHSERLWPKDPAFELLDAPKRMPAGAGLSSSLLLLLFCGSLSVQTCILAFPGTFAPSKV